MAKLLEKHKRFGDEFLVDLNGKQAAIRAGYSKKTADVQGCQLLTNPNIQEYIKKRMDARSERTEITQDMVLKRWAQIAFANIKDYITWTPDGIVQMKGSDELTKEQAASLSEIIQVSGKNNSFRLKMKDDLKALDSIAKHLGMFMDRGLNPNEDIIPPEQIDSMERIAQERLKAIKGQVH